MKVIIIEDNKFDQAILEKLIKSDKDLTLGGTFDNAIEAISCLDSVKPDLIFLDVEMPGMNGLEFLTSITSVPQIILITSHRKYALDAFENDVTDFILKPIDQERFIKSVAKAKQINEWLSLANDDDNSIFVRVDRENVKLKLNDILYVESMADYIRIITNDRKYTVLCSMKSIASKLPENSFARIHRSTIVNTNKISSYDSSSLLIGDKEFSISRRGKSELSKVLSL